jgi:hypothetical protein
LDYDNLDTMSVAELDQLLAQIAKCIAHEEWKEQVKRLEIEATDAVEALRQLTGRDYKFSLGACTVAPKAKRAPRMRFELAAA